MSQDRANQDHLNQDVLAHYHMYDFRARCVVAVTTEVTRQAQQRHNLDPLTTIAVGRAITCAALLASTLKEPHEYVHCSFSGSGVLKRVIGECNGAGHCRGYAAPARIELLLPEGAPVPMSVGEALGDGLLTVTRGHLGEKEPYNAVSALLNGEIAADVARFLTESEQIPSAVAAGVKLASDGRVLGAGGVLVQRLGGATLEENALIDLEKRMADSLHISERIARGEGLDDLVAQLQGGPTGFGRLTQRSLAFICGCSREKMASALFALGEDEVRAIQAETGKIEVRCQYCGSTQAFRMEELLTH